MKKNYLYLIKLLVKNDIKRKYRNSVLGIIWSLLSPLLEMIVLTIVFSTLLSRSIDNFPVYLLSGRLLYGFFASSTTMTMKSIVQSAGLLRKIAVSKYVLALSKIISNFIIFLISLVALFIVMLATNAIFSVNLLYAPLYLIMLFVFSLGVGLILATIYVFFRDTEYLYSVFTTVLAYASAIFYPASIVPKNFQWLLNINPIFHYIKGFRNVVYYVQPINWNNFFICTIIAIVSLIIGVGLFNWKKNKFIYYL